MKPEVLMVGVAEGRVGGMWTVADLFMKDELYNREVNLTYVATSTCGTLFARIFIMIKGIFKILVILMNRKVDIVHIHMAEKGSVYRKGIVVYLAKFFCKKVIVQMHAGPILAWYNSIASWQKKIVLRILNKSDKILVLGEYWKNEIADLVHDGSKIEVVYNGSYVPENNLYCDSGKNIIYLGLIKKEKGTYDLVDSIALIDNQLEDDIKVYLCGIDEDNRMKDYIKKKALEHRVYMLGWITKDERIELFKNTMMCVLPSYFEALSMTVIEAMCYGIPVITTSITTMPELLGEEIEMVAPGDIERLSNIILRISKSHDMRMRMSAIEYDRAKNNFSTNNMVERTLLIYKLM